MSDFAVLMLSARRVGGDDVADDVLTSRWLATPSTVNPFTEPSRELVISLRGPSDVGCRDPDLARDLNMALGRIRSPATPAYDAARARSWSDEMYFKMSGLPPEGSLGSHDVTISATDSAGLSTVANLNLKVKPRFVRTVNAAVNYDFELENWFGDFYIMDSGWCYHLDFGWIYLVPNQSGKQLWFWQKDWGWSWTSKEHWFASRQSGFLYIDQIQAWIYFTTSSNYTTARAYLYSQMKWVVYSSGIAQ